MARREFPVEDDESGSRLETFLRKRLGLPRNVAFKALRKGWVRVDGKRAKGNLRLEVGQQVKITNYALPLPAIDEAPEPPPPVPDEVVQAQGGWASREVMNNVYTKLTDRERAVAIAGAAVKFSRSV